MQVRDNVAEEYELDNVFSQKGAYEYILHKLYVYNNQLPDSTLLGNDNFFRAMRLENFISPNLIALKKLSLPSNVESGN